MALIGLAVITIVFSISILLGFVISLIMMKKDRKTYWVFILILSLPLILLLSIY